MTNYQILVKLVECSIKLKKLYSPQISLLEQCSKNGVLDYLNFKFIPKVHLVKGVGIRLRISVYLLPRNQIMKIHDHNGMKILTYVMEGQMELLTYTQQENNIYLRRNKNIKKGDYSTIQGKENNLHSMKAVTHSLFLDIIFPDYDQQNQCYFYEEIGELRNDRIQLKKLKDQIGPQFYMI